MIKHSCPALKKKTELISTENKEARRKAAKSSSCWWIWSILPHFRTKSQNFKYSTALYTRRVKTKHPPLLKFCTLLFLSALIRFCWLEKKTYFIPVLLLVMPIKELSLTNSIEHPNLKVIATFPRNTRNQKKNPYFFFFFKVESTTKPTTLASWTTS